jgi:sulfatase modifying factor 1
MKTTAVLAALILLTGAAFADSSDDAEARRRGVPVSQVQAEKALAAEKSKTADLEKQLAALKAQLAKLGGTVTPPAASGPAAGGSRAAGGAKSLTLDLGDHVTLKVLQIPAGKFIMGATPPQKQMRNERAHEVTISKAFYIGMTNVTVEQFAAFVNATGYKTTAERTGATDDKMFVGGTWGSFEGSTDTWRTPPFPQAGNHPVVEISWDDAQAFCDWLMKKSGKNVSLPTEAQWEYAERGGTKTEYIWGDKPDGGKGWANCAGAEVDKLLPRQGIDYNFYCFSWDDGFVYTSPVGHYKPNGYGLYDMVGNASQWCLDGPADYQPGAVTDPLLEPKSNAKAIRGGSWCTWEDEARAAYRSWSPHDGHDDTMGMRIVVNQ